MIGKSLLHAPNDPLYCYCPPGVCQAPKGFRGPCRRYSDAVKDAETEYQSWIALLQSSRYPAWLTHKVTLDGTTYIVKPDVRLTDLPFKKDN